MPASQLRYIIIRQDTAVYMNSKTFEIIDETSSSVEAASIGCE
jgi:hypothetical protein